MDELGKKIGEPLTANELKRFDEIGADQAAIDNTLKVALQFHANSANRISKSSSSLWDDVLGSRGISKHDGPFTVNRKTGIPFIQKVSRDDLSNEE